MATAPDRAPPLAIQGRLPNLAALTVEEKTSWLNSGPLTPTALSGKVVLVDFWTYSCINSLRNVPYVRSWAAKYRDAGLVVIGVHTPEFGFERDTQNVAQAVRDHRITYPVALDSNYRIWDAFSNEYWPADYVIDGSGRIRYQHFGEGDYDRSERAIRELLRENGGDIGARSSVQPAAQGVEAPPSDAVQSPETYAGYRRAESFASPERLQNDRRATYTAPAELPLNGWALAGTWNVGGESAQLVDGPGSIVFRFLSRDLHVVLAPETPTSVARFTLKLDGKPPGSDHGVDAAADGAGVVREPRLYQLIRQTGTARERTLEIRFLDSGVHAFVFTFG
jgi:thiol-disulfide isomerase/thioredoxin